jgi:hypothetical protein
MRRAVTDQRGRCVNQRQVSARRPRGSDDTPVSSREGDGMLPRPRRGDDMPASSRGGDDMPGRCWCRWWCAGEFSWSDGMPARSRGTDDMPASFRGGDDVPGRCWCRWRCAGESRGTDDTLASSRRGDDTPGCCFCRRRCVPACSATDRRHAGRFRRMSYPPARRLNPLAGIPLRTDVGRTGRRVVASAGWPAPGLASARSACRRFKENASACRPLTDMAGRRWWLAPASCRAFAANRRACGWPGERSDSACRPLGEQTARLLCGDACRVSASGARTHPRVADGRGTDRRVGEWRRAGR